VVKNTCFDNEAIFNLNIRDLVKPEWVNCWTTIRNLTTLEEICALSSKNDNCFEKVAFGGFFMPLTYHYDIGIEITLSTEYSSSSTSESEHASEAINAGLSVSYFGAKASIKSAINKGISSSTTSTKYSNNVHVVTNANGADVDISCLQKGDCSTVIADAVTLVRNDLDNLGTIPSSQSNFIQLDDIIKWYFNDDIGLPGIFHEAVTGPFFECILLCSAVHSLSC